MAKSAWKFLKTDQKQLYMHNYEYKLLIKNQGYQKYGFVKNSFIINNINYGFKYVSHIGNEYLHKKFYKYCIGLKMREFLKFKKPFYFRSKKKK